MPGYNSARPKPKNCSLEKHYKPVNQSISQTGNFNAGILIVRRDSDGRRCVEKRLKPREIADGRAKFEISLLRKLSHCNIVEYLDAFIDVRGPTPKASIITEYADLGNPQDFYQKRRAARKPHFKELSIWTLFAQLANALAYLQYGVSKATSQHCHERGDES